MAGKSDYLENKLIDFIFRGQAFVPPTTVHIGLLTAAPSDAGGGTEVSGGSYQRGGTTPGSGIACSTTNFAGTQGAGTTAVSSGSGGQTSNNVVINFPAPTADWGVVTHMGIYDAATSGNLLYWAALTTPKTINNGDAAPSFAAAALTVTED